MIRLSLLLFLVVVSGCAYGRANKCCNLRNADVYPFTSEAVRSLPCGPDQMLHGYKATVWTEWPSYAPMGLDSATMTSEETGPTATSAEMGSSVWNDLESELTEPTRIAADTANLVELAAVDHQELHPSDSSEVAAPEPATSEPAAVATSPFTELELVEPGPMVTPTRETANDSADGTEKNASDPTRSPHFTPQKPLKMFR